MKRSISVALALFSGTLHAVELSPTTQAEVAHLFEYLASSNCQLYRNGSWHEPREAVDHLEMKYRYLMKKRLVPTAEAFIERAATESSVSGKPYLVKCGDAKPVASATWFRDELARYRSTVK